MNDLRQHASERIHWSPSGSARSNEIAQFRLALDAIVGLHNEEESALNALIDFFACRCRNTQQLHTLGAKLFTALNSQAPVLVTIGVFDEQFAFRREQDDVRIEVDQQELAGIPLDSAIRLATLLHGARHLATNRQCAA